MCTVVEVGVCVEMKDYSEVPFFRLCCFCLSPVALQTPLYHTQIGRTPNDAPYDKRTGVYFFTIPKFLRTGTFRLVFDVTAKQPPHADPVTNAKELGELAPPAPPRRFAKVAPIELDVEVCLVRQ